ncbi:MAG: hypothetical protein ACE5KT_06525 [Methanosarcinales archaeon]
MQKYDISLKRLLELGKKEIINFILKREVEIEEEIEPSEIIERRVSRCPLITPAKGDYITLRRLTPPKQKSYLKGGI